MYYSKIHNLETGDKIVEPLFSTGLTKHYAIYLGIDRNGIEWIAENHKFKNVQIIRADQYFSSAKIERIDKFVGSVSDRKKVISRAVALTGKHYDLITYNCEHFASEITTGYVQSFQIKNAFAFLIGVIFLNLLIQE